MFQVDSSGWCQTQIPPAGLLGPFFMAKHHGGNPHDSIMTHQTQQTSFINPGLTPLFRPNIFKHIQTHLSRAFWRWTAALQRLQRLFLDFDAHSRPLFRAAEICGNGRSLYSCAAWPKMFIQLAEATRQHVRSPNRPNSLATWATETLQCWRPSVILSDEN